MTPSHESHAAAAYDRMEDSRAFGAPVYHIAETGSTMQDARFLSAQGAPDGTAVYADFQRSGRGRIEGRVWDGETGKDLLCTVMLKRQPPPGFTLRVGLAVSRVFERYLSGSCCTQIKWPNDVLADGKKLAGILCESDGEYLYIGTGFNIGRTSFPEELARKASSLALLLRETGTGEAVRSPQTASFPQLPSIREVLETWLEELRLVLEDEEWNRGVTERLYRKNETLRFLNGDPERNEYIEGILVGIGPSGELLVRESGSEESTPPRRLFSGEIPY